MPWALVAGVLAIVASSADCMKGRCDGAVCADPPPILYVLSDCDNLAWSCEVNDARYGGSTNSDAGQSPIGYFDGTKPRTIVAPIDRQKVSAPWLLNIEIHFRGNLGVPDGSVRLGFFRVASNGAPLSCTSVSGSTSGTTVVELQCGLPDDASDLEISADAFTTPFVVAPEIDSTACPNQRTFTSCEE